MLPPTLRSHIAHTPSLTLFLNQRLINSITYILYVMSKLLTVTISNPVHDTLERYMKAVNNDVPDYMRLSKSKFVDACIKAALESKGVPIVPYKIVEEPVVINPDTYMPPVVRKKPSLPPL